MRTSYGLLLALLAGCSQSNSAELSGVSGTTDAILCEVEEAADQRLVYAEMNPLSGKTAKVDEVLSYRYAWACDAGERIVVGNGVPNHAVTNGQFATRVSAQSVAFRMTLEPEVAGAITTVEEPGYALSSVKFDPATAGTCPDEAADVTDWDPGMGTDTWRMVALPGNVSPWRWGFGVAESNAHAQPTGQYHYHGDPVGLAAALNPQRDARMTLVG